MIKNNSLMGFNAFFDDKAFVRFNQFPENTLILVRKSKTLCFSPLCIVHIIIIQKAFI
jgi:hypothetical protein